MSLSKIREIRPDHTNPGQKTRLRLQKLSLRPKITPFLRVSSFETAWDSLFGRERSKSARKFKLDQPYETAHVYNSTTTSSRKTNGSCGHPAIISMKGNCRIGYLHLPRKQTNVPDDAVGEALEIAHCASPSFEFWRPRTILRSSLLKVWENSLIAGSS